MLYSLEYPWWSEIKIHVQALFNILLGEIHICVHHSLGNFEWGTTYKKSHRFCVVLVYIARESGLKNPIVYMTSVRVEAKIPTATWCMCAVPLRGCVNRRDIYVNHCVSFLNWFFSYLLTDFLKKGIIMYFVENSR